MTSVRITQTILDGNLFNIDPDGYDVRASVEEYASLCEGEFIDAVREQWPDADIKVEQIIRYGTSGYARNTSMLVFDGDEILNSDGWDERLDTIEQDIYEDMQWMVENEEEEA